MLYTKLKNPIEYPKMEKNQDYLRVLHELLPLTKVLKQNIDFHVIDSKPHEIK